MSNELLSEVTRFRERIAAVEEELVYESGVYSLDPYQLRIAEEHLEMLQLALHLFIQPEQLISWVTEDKDGLTLVIMPKKVKEVLKEHVFSRKMPIVFSSATLSVEQSFDYMASGLGIQNYLSFSVPSPYDYPEQMKAALYPDDPGIDKISKVLELLEQSKGRALLLFPSMEELQAFQHKVRLYPNAADFRFFFEGTAEISFLISAFQNDEHSVLCAVTLWEGLDIPGPSLSQVIIWELPFPPNDPVFTARRKDASDPFHEVDMPYMLLRLKQGVGRLIRTREDQGTISIFGRDLNTNSISEQVQMALPDGVLLCTEESPA